MGTEARTSPAGASNLGDEVRATVGRLYRRFRTERADGSLGDAALEVLTYLQKHGPQTLTGLSEQGRVSPASMSQTVNRLTSASYAVRTGDPTDRRKVLFSATPEGERLALATRAQRNAWLDAQLAALGPDDRRAIAHACALLGTIAES